MSGTKSGNAALRKSLGVMSVFSIAAGAMISSGLFVLPGIAYKIAGPGIILAYFLASLLMIPVMLSKAELSTAMPKSGGSYFHIERSLGPLIGTVAGFAGWCSIMLKATFALVGLGALGILLKGEQDEWTLKAIALGGCVIFTALNIFSVKGSGRVQSVLVFALLGILIGYVAGGIPHLSEANYHPFMPGGWQPVFAVAGMVFISYGGLTKVVAVAEEIKSPKTNIPLGMFAASVVVSILYVLVIFVTVGLVEPEGLSGSYMPISQGAAAIMGRPGVIIICIGAFLAFATTANSGILSASRSPLAMSRDGLLPAFFAKTSRKRGTPIIAICFTSVCMGALIIFLSIENLVKTASTMMLLMFFCVNLAVIIMRASKMQNYRPTFRAPLCPWLQLATNVIYVFLIIEMGLLPLLLTAGFVLAAVLWYFIYVHLRIDRQSALVYLVMRILSRHIKQAKPKTLEHELAQIVLERDEVTFDRFDHLVNECPVLDLAEPLDARTFFRRVAEVLASRVGLKTDALYELFLERERESSTVIQPGLAIPHVIVPGTEVFEIVLVRCAPGIVFSELHEPVRTAFVLVGSRDERNYHLRALMIIAQIIQEGDFEERWKAAADSQQLRHVLLLAGRTRDKHS